jgi:polysaccharide export outer membrane protein
MTREAILAALLVAGLQTGGAASSDPGPTAYVVGPADVLRVLVWKQPDLSGTYTVGPEGGITLPLVGHVPVAGLTPPSIQEALTKRLGDGFLRDPQVVVSVEQHRSQRVFVSGEVRQPGVIVLTGPLTLLEALARAGALTDRAGGTAVIARPRNAAAGPAAFTGESEIVRIDLAGLTGGDLRENVPLRDGDTVFVPAAATVHVMGEVARPGEYPILASTRVAEVLSRAGGVTDRGSSRRLRVVRMESGKKIETSVALEDVLRPGDIVVVRERLF